MTDSATMAEYKAALLTDDICIRVAISNAAIIPVNQLIPHTEILDSRKSYLSVKIFPGSTFSLLKMRVAKVPETISARDSADIKTSINAGTVICPLVNNNPAITVCRVPPAFMKPCKTLLRGQSV